MNFSQYALWTGLFGGLALFLFGMDLLTRALKVVAGDGMKGILGRLTSNRFMGTVTGAVVTAIVNSSSVTTVIMVGFVSAGLMSMAQSVGVIMGANIGSTVTAQILAFKVSKIALPMITVGFLGFFLPKKPKVKQYGAALLGLGLVFYGMSVMSEAMKPLRTFEPFLDFMVTMDVRLVAILVGAVFTAVIQSSAATTGIVIVMAGQGLMPLETAIAVALGANVGTCATAGLAVIGKPREAVRCAVVHVLFNVAGVALWYAFVPELAEIARSISSAPEALPEAERAAAAAPRQIANAHTLFNIANTAIFLPFTTQIARLVEWLVPDRPLPEGRERLRPRYLDESLLNTPALALARARLEIGRLGRRAVKMYGAIMPVVLTGNRQELEEVAELDDELDDLHEAIIEYLRRIGVDTLTREQAAEFVTLMKVANAFEAVGDVVESDMVSIGTARLEGGLKVSDETLQVIGDFHRFVQVILEDSVEAAVEKDDLAALNVIDAQEEVSHLADDAHIHGAHRLMADEPNRLIAYQREMDVVERIKRVYYFAKRVAETVHPDRESRRRRRESVAPPRPSIRVMLKGAKPKE